MNVIAHPCLRNREHPSGPDLETYIRCAHALRARAVRELLRRGARALGRPARALAASLARAHAERRTLRALAGLDDRTLADIGLRREELPLVASTLAAPPGAGAMRPPDAAPPAGVAHPEPARDRLAA